MATRHESKDNQATVVLLMRFTVPNRINLLRSRFQSESEGLVTPMSTVLLHLWAKVTGRSVLEHTGPCLGNPSVFFSSSSLRNTILHCRNEASVVGFKVYTETQPGTIL